MKVFIGFILLALSTTANAFSYTKKFTEAELQKRVEAMMPMEKKKLLLTIVITSPKLQLVQTSNEIGIQTNVKAIIPGGFSGTGTINITGKISYRQKEGAFYLSNPTIVDMHVNGLHKKYQRKVKDLAQKAISKTLSSHPVYKFKDNSLKHKLAKSVLESVTVENKKMIIKLSVF